jgi:hypothetical protein
MVRTLEWVGQQSAELLARWEQIPSVHLAAEPVAMLRLLAELNDVHGSVRAYVTSIGVGEEILLTLEAALLEAADG